MKIHRFKSSSVQYNTETGTFIWLYCHRKPWMNGRDATHETSNHYLYIKADGKMHSASRLAYRLMTGRPVPADLEVDHINQIKGDNRFCNLRVVDRTTNLANKYHPIGLTGHRGVSFHYYEGNTSLEYRARKGNKTTYHETLEEAIAGYAKLASEACD